MKIKSLLLILALIIIQVPLTAQQKTKKAVKPAKAKTETIQLFNGKNLNNWTFFLRDHSVDPAKVFSVRNGVIQIAGEPFGYMRTKESYSEYVLNVEWRWPGEATNSGVFIHAQLPDTIWPRCIECQLKAGSAGDFVCMSGADINERTDKAVRSVNKIADTSEKPAGEWNTMEVKCAGNTITVYINGVLQNKGTGSNITGGFICLQSEGRDIEFRNVKLTRLKK